MSTEESMFLRIPAEIRMQIYGYLLDNGGKKSIAIRNKSRCKYENTKEDKKPRRSLYHILERSFSRLAYETTYYLQSDHSMYPAILCANRKIREEASHYLYGTHSFHFGEDLEAVIPFLDDRTPATRDLIKNITLYKRRPTNSIESDSYDWTAICRFIKSLNKLKKLTLVIEGGRPRREWDGPQELSVSDFRLLYSTRHDSLEWARELAAVKTVGEVEIVADIHYIPEPKTNMTLVFAAFSASIETSLVEFLRDDLGIPAKVAEKWSDGRGSTGLRQRQSGVGGGCVAS